MPCSMCAGVLSEHVSLLGMRGALIRGETVRKLTPGGASTAPTGCQEIAEALSHGGGTRTEAIPAARAA